VFEIARQVQQVMLGLPPGWLAAVPGKFLRRQLELSSAEKFLDGSRELFIKPTCSKAFPAGVYTPATLEPLLAELDASFPVYLAEPVAWTMEFRAFILNGAVETISAYRYLGRDLTNYDQPLKVSANHLRAARSFAGRFLEACADSSPPAYVLDVGYIEKRGWAVIEGNECCASGIYTCDPAAVLKVLLQGTLPLARLSEDDRRWDFEPHYYDSFAPRRGHAATLRPQKVR
jgi:hypothetical protein